MTATTPPLSLALLAALLATALSACAAPATPQTAAAATPPADSATLLLQIRAEIGDAGCDSDAQCRTLGVGAKPCGGPEAYLPWSTRVSSAARLEGLAEQHRALRRAENERSGLRSNCMFLPDPGALCRPATADGKRSCQLGSGAAGSAL